MHHLEKAWDIRELVNGPVAHGQQNTSYVPLLGHKRSPHRSSDRIHRDGRGRLRQVDLLAGFDVPRQALQALARLAKFSVRSAFPRRSRAQMDARTFNRSKLPSRHVSEGPSRAAHHVVCAPNLENVKFDKNQNVACSVSKPISAMGGVVGLVSTSAPPADPRRSGALRTYADQVGPAGASAVTHAGGGAEVACYADI